MSLGLAMRCFVGALSGGETATRLRRALAGIKDPPEIKEVIREVAVPMRDAPPPREIIREVLVEVPVEVIKEVVKEVPVEVIKEVIREVPVEVIKEVIKEVPVEVIREVVKEVPVEVVREVPAGAPAEVVREVVKEVPVEVIKEVVREVPREIVKETIREVPIETVREVVKVIPDTHGPALLLALLQQDGRLVDFLNEDLDNLDDEHVGAAVREIHSRCRRALRRYVTLAPVLPEKEGEVVSLGGSYDAAAVRLTGKVTDKAPMFGTLRHRGWKVLRVELPPRPTGADPAIIMPAEVEVE